MPVFSYTSPNIEKNGAIISVDIFPPFAVIKDLQDKKENIPTKKLIGLIDTGASCSGFNAPIAQELNLIVRDQQPVLTPSGESTHFLYDVVVVLGDFFTRGIPIQAYGVDLSRQPFDFLIGRDILKYCTLIFNGWNNSYDLHLHPEDMTS
jgi:hypothetical protein